MAMLYFPSGLAGLLQNKRPFFEAFTRLRDPPSFRRVSLTERPPFTLWSELLRAPFVFVMSSSLPLWLEELASDRPLGFLTPDVNTENAAAAFRRVITGSLRGTADLVEYYRVLRQLCNYHSQDASLDEETTATLLRISDADLMLSRSRLDFVPGVPLPQPWNGRSAAYLLNRLSNNVDEPALLAESEDPPALALATMLAECVPAVSALSLLELGKLSSSNTPIPATEIQDTYDRIASSMSPEKKLDIVRDLGRRLKRGSPPDRLLIAVPTVRLDLMRSGGSNPASQDSPSPRVERGAVRAVSDLIQQRASSARPSSVEENKAYERARETLLLEQRFLACQCAYLATRTNSIPIQLRPCGNDIHHRIKDLNRALSVNSRKVPMLFREVERRLAGLIPAPVQAWLSGSTSGIVILSDLPFEWALVDQWPLCLVRPVSRIPAALTQTDVLIGVLENNLTISRSPERVLILDLIGDQDPIRRYSDHFASASTSLGQKYTYAKPHNAATFRDLLSETSPEIVVLDAHGKYDSARDELWITLPEGNVSVDQLLPDLRVPPVWVLSACDTSVTGALRGCFVRRLLDRGAACVVASLARVDAGTASLFVGRLLTEVLSPGTLLTGKGLDEVIFVTQVTTALLYDPLLPLFRRAERDVSLRRALGGVMQEYFDWASTPRELRTFRESVPWVLGEAIARRGLTKMYVDAQQAGNIRPETLLFTAFGAPGRIGLQ